MDDNNQNDKKPYKIFTLSFKVDKKTYHCTKLLASQLHGTERGKISTLLSTALDDYLVKNLGGASKKLFNRLNDSE